MKDLFTSLNSGWVGLLLKLLILAVIVGLWFGGRVQSPDQKRELIDSRLGPVKIQVESNADRIGVVSNRLSVHEAKPGHDVIVERTAGLSQKLDEMKVTQQKILDEMKVTQQKILDELRAIRRNGG